MTDIPGVHLAVDVGGKRTGLAASDEFGRMVLPHGKIESEDLDDVARHVALAAKEVDAVCVVIGLPLNMDGSEGPQAQKMRDFGNVLRNLGVVRVDYQDERLTSHAVESEMARAGMKRNQRKARSDEAAACLILNSYLHRVHSINDAPDAAPEHAPFKPGHYRNKRRR